MDGAARQSARAHTHRCEHALADHHSSPTLERVTAALLLPVHTDVVAASAAVARQNLGWPLLPAPMRRGVRDSTASGDHTSRSRAAATLASAAERRGGTGAARGRSVRRCEPYGHDALARARRAPSAALLPVRARLSYAHEQRDTRPRRHRTSAPNITARGAHAWRPGKGVSSSP